ncbi:GntR family transcriptional regulator [Azospirillum sp. ST 5-10]|uniref:GntR family transcriptional regulator n=1 Tax=unclassified Azospirillum TaxID=2630922 RepID=UPI003F49BE93
MKPLNTQPILIDQVYERLVESITAGELPPGVRVRQEDLAARLGVSRQPVSHALQLLRRQGLLEEAGKRGWIVARIDVARIRDLYQIRTELDGLAVRLAADRVARRVAEPDRVRALEAAIERGSALSAAACAAACAAYVRADVDFHTALYRLSGNAAIEETVAAQWLQLQRAMAVVLADAGVRPRIWQEHAEIARLVLAGDVGAAEAAARKHTDEAAKTTASRLSTVADAA